MKFSFAHIVGIVGGGLASIAALNPALIAAVYPPAVPYAAAAIAAASALLALGHAITTGVSNKAEATAISTAAKLVPLFALALMFSGCASIESFISSPTGAATVTAAVDVAVATAESKGVPAAQINSIAKTVLAADSGTAGTLAALSALVDSQIAKAGLPAADLAAAQILEVALAAGITAKIGNNADLAAAQAAVATVLQEVIAASGG